MELPVQLPSGPERSGYPGPPRDGGPCPGSRVGSQGTYLCPTADRAPAWLQDRMNVSSPHGVFQDWRVGLTFYFPTPSHIPIGAVSLGVGCRPRVRCPSQLHLSIRKDHGVCPPPQRLW